MKKDKQFKDLMDLNQELIILTEEIIESIKMFYPVTTGGMSEHMKTAISNYQEYLKRNYSVVS